MCSIPLGIYIRPPQAYMVVYGGRNVARPFGAKTKRPLDRIISPARIEAWRASVRVNAIRDRLERQSLGILTTRRRVKEKGKIRVEIVPYDMSPSELKAAHMLLERCIPTVSAVEITGKDGGPVESHVTFYLPKNGRG